MSTKKEKICKIGECTFYYDGTYIVDGTGDTRFWKIEDGRVFYRFSGDTNWRRWVTGSITGDQVLHEIGVALIEKEFLK